jgi:D-alanyl-D-alanine carboxypeptidase/D-alanyl-D-alanine-endopeptidase (penicillin-binding protein 4)
MKIPAFLFTFLFLLLAWPAQAALPPEVLRALQSGGIPEDAVSVYVRRVDGDLPVLAQRDERAMNPASVMKLLTTYAGLELLGPAYAWRTELYAAAPPVEGVLHGDLILKGYGDPTLTQEKFWNLIHGLRVEGVREIRGDLVLDRSFFEASEFDPGAFDGDPYRPYNSGPDALLVNFKSTSFHIRPEANGVAIKVDPELPHLKVVNRLKPATGSCMDWKNRLAYDVRQDKEGWVVSFNGSYAASCANRTLDLSLPAHPEYIFQLFKTLWREQDGIFHGKLREGSAPPKAVLLTQTFSPPLADVIRQINKYSNNLMARQLLITLGAERGGIPGNAAKGAEAIRAWLAANGMAFPELVIENGSGLSRIERISARHLGELLLTAYGNPFMPELMSSLPLMAVDGTLQRRTQVSALAGRAHLKSGSLDDVRAIAGYLLDEQGRRWVVVMMVNHPYAAASKPAQDALLEWVYHQD